MWYATTSHNRTVYASPPVGGSGYGFARSLRYAPFPRKPSATFCRPWSLLRKDLIRAAKTSQTAGTLGAIPQNFQKIQKIIKKTIDINEISGYT
jgi:hypothetical protein